MNQVQGRNQKPVHVDGVAVELQAPGLDGGEVEDIADHRHQAASGIQDALGVFALAVVEGAEVFLAQHIGEADDGVQWRAHLIGHVGDEFGLQPVGFGQRLGTLAQGLFDPGRIGDVHIAQQHGAVGQRHVGVFDHRAVVEFELTGGVVAAHQAGDDTLLVDAPAQVVPAALHRDLGTGVVDEIGNVVVAVKRLLVKAPQPREHWVGKLQPAIAAEHGDAFVQVVERLPLHRVQGLVRTLQVQAFGNVIEPEHQSVLGVAVDKAADRTPGGQV